MLMTAQLLIFSAVKVLRGVSIVRCQHQMTCVCVCTRARAHVHTCAYTWVCTCACVFYSLRKPEGTNSDPILRSLETDSRKLLCRKVGTIFLFLTRQLYKCVRVGCILHHSN